MDKRFTAKESNNWLRDRMKKLGIASLSELSELTGIDRDRGAARWAFAAT